jgi:hypothetical protein
MNTLYTLVTIGRSGVYSYLLTEKQSEGKGRVPFQFYSFQGRQKDSIPPAHPFFTAAIVSIIKY